MGEGNGRNRPRLILPTFSPEGTGTAERLKDLCQHDDDAIKAINEVLQRPVGATVGNANAVRDIEITVDNVNNCIEKDLLEPPMPLD